MDFLSLINKPIEQEIADFNAFFKSQLKSDVMLMNDALSFLSESIGKMMRPTLVLLVAKSIGNINEKTFSAATAVEMLHTASLLHDDVIDEAYHRRGEFSANALYRGKKAVLIGDFILAAIPTQPSLCAAKVSIRSVITCASSGVAGSDFCPRKNISFTIGLIIILHPFG